MHGRNAMEEDKEQECHGGACKDVEGHGTGI